MGTVLSIKMFLQHHPWIGAVLENPTPDAKWLAFSLTPTNFPTLWHQPSVLQFHAKSTSRGSVRCHRCKNSVPQDYCTSGTSGQCQVLSLPYFCPNWLQSHDSHTSSLRDEPLRFSNLLQRKLRGKTMKEEEKLQEMVSWSHEERVSRKRDDWWLCKKPLIAQENERQNDH